MKKYFFFIVFFFVSHKLLSQTCKVNVDSLMGEYNGECKKGKAEGTGTAIGTDSYTGSFKNGYPDGEGKYTWKNGSWYDGFWKTGLFDNKGSYRNIDNNASVLTGFWKKGKYMGKFENPFVVHTLTNGINEVNVRMLNAIHTAEAEITISIKSITAGASSLSNPILPKPQLVNVEFIEGRFDQQVADETSRIANRYVLRRIQFPLYAIFTFQTPGSKIPLERLGLELHENGNWNVEVNLEN